jgi:ferredoxin-thioredoxin reductase catalytic subunit
MDKDTVKKILLMQAKKITLDAAYNKQDEVTTTILSKLIENDLFCPCQHPSSISTICPCNLFAKHHICKCGLFIVGTGDD